MNKDWLDISVLEDYLDGKLDAKTMNRVEREALDDPFVAEALAGLSESPKRSLQSISLLQKQLHERVTEYQYVKKSSVITWQRLSIAATAAVMFVAVSIMFWMRENNQQKELAGRAKKVDVMMAPTIPAADSSVVAAAPVLADRAVEQVKEKEVDKAIRAAKTNSYAVRIKANTAIPQPTPPQLNEIVVVGYGVQRKQSMTGAVASVSNEMNLLSGKIVGHDDGKPLAGVSVRLNGTNLTAVTNVNGEFSIPTDTAVKEGSLYVNYLGFKATELLAKANEPVNVSLMPDQQFLNEVAVTSVSKEKKKLEVSPKLAASVPGQTENIRIRGMNSVSSKVNMVSNPVGGWSKLWEYIGQNNAFKDEKKVGQIVELSFKIKKDGTPIDLRIEKKADSKYEEEAIRLILNGPKWEKPDKSNSRMTFVIDF